ncbi:MAG: glutathione S-transferase family protein [Pseudomonadota bacterium]
MYKLLGRATSGNVQKVIFLLKEINAAYERVDYGRQFENTTTPEYLAINPTQKVPTLVDGDLTIWESHTILRYVAAKEKSTLIPTDIGARTQVERWMDWLLAALNSAYLGGFRDAKKTEAERAPDTVKNLVTELAILEKQLGKTPWVAGAEFSLADIALGPIVKRCVAFPFDMPATPNISAWLAKLAERPAFVAATAA